LFRIRFHGRGGQGMKTASRILGTALFIEGYEVQDAPRYGAERRGAPIFAYVRADKKPINERGVIGNPGLVVVADDTLMPVPAAGVLEGLGEESVLLINSHDSIEIWQQRLNTPATILQLPASEDVEDRAELPYIGTYSAAAAVALVGVISIKSLKQAIEEELGHLGKQIVEANLAKASEAYELMSEHQGIVKEGSGVSATDYAKPAWIELPFDAAQISAPAIHAAATSEIAKTGLWRTMRPLIEYEHCKGCWWICSTFCPDGAITVNENKLPEIDYDHCKGCLICVAQCPSHAITAEAEHSAQQGAQQEIEHEEKAHES